MILKKQKPRNIAVSGFFLVQYRVFSLSLAELGCTTCAFETVLLSFLHSRVTSEEACLLEYGTNWLVVLKESTGKTVTDCACLACYTATVYTAYDVELLGCAGELEGLANNELECIKTEVIVDWTVVDDDFTCTCVNAYTCYRLLSASRLWKLF